VTRLLARGLCFAVAGAALALSGCAAKPEPRPTPSVIATPAIVWTDGVEPSSPLEQNKFVRFLRASLLGEAVAWNSGDFAVDQLISTSAPERIEFLINLYEEQHVVQWKYLGPLPIEPVSVDEAADGMSARVVFCIGADSDWQLRTAGSSNDSPPSTAFVGQVEVTGSRRAFVRDGFSPTDQSCGATSVPVGHFNPPVTVPEDPFAHPVEGVKRAPLKWQLDELKRTVR
jgi:hypothetical protein